MSLQPVRAIVRHIVLTLATCPVLAAHRARASAPPTAPAEQWPAAQPRELRGDPAPALGQRRGLREDLAAQAADAATRATLEAVTTSAQHLEPRRTRSGEAAFRAAGAPVGSGSAASAHAAVV